jgi:hypothetical protein
MPEIMEVDQVLTSMVSNGPPALSGWNCTPQILLPDSGVEMMPSTEESLQLMKNGAQPSGNSSVSFSAYWWFCD